MLYRTPLLLLLLLQLLLLLRFLASLLLFLLMVLAPVQSRRLLLQLLLLPLLALPLRVLLRLLAPVWARLLLPPAAWLLPMLAQPAVAAAGLLAVTAAAGHARLLTVAAWAAFQDRSQIQGGTRR
jgi:hypothetical protein